MAGNPELQPFVEQGLRMKEIGEKLLKLIGGREVQPIYPCVGGFYYAPRRSALMQLSDELAWGSRPPDTACPGWPPCPPRLTTSYEFIALSHPEEYPMGKAG